MLRRTALGLLAGNALAARRVIAGSSNAARMAGVQDPSQYPYQTLTVGQVDWIGFGARASSLIGGIYATTHSDPRPYTASPITLKRIPAAQVAGGLLPTSPQLFEGVVASLWEKRLRISLTELMAQPPFMAALDRATRGHTR